MSIALTHNGLPDKWKRHDLLSLFRKIAKPAFNLSSRSIRLMEYLIFAARENDYEPGKICAIWQSAETIAGELGVSIRSINRAELELEQAHFMMRTSGRNRTRNGRRCENPDKPYIEWAFGINLAPLIDRVTQLQAKAQLLELQRISVEQCQVEIKAINKRIRALGSADNICQANSILPDGRVANVTKLELLEETRDALNAVLRSIEQEPCATKRVNSSDKNVAPIIPKETLSEFCSDAQDASNCGIEQSPISVGRLIKLASYDFQLLMASKGAPSIINIVETSATMCAALNISQRDWGEACMRLGRVRAALCVLIIDRNMRLPKKHRYHRNNPSGSLVGMIRKGQENLNLNGLLRAMEGYQRDDWVEVRSVVQQPLRGVKSFASLASTIVANAARQKMEAVI